MSRWSDVPWVPFAEQPSQLADEAQRWLDTGWQPEPRDWGYTAFITGAALITVSWAALLAAITYHIARSIL